MCGLVGAMGPTTLKHENAFKTLLILDSVRGIDSTGVAVVDGAGNVKLAKTVGNPFELFDRVSFTDAMRGLNKVFIGHNRYATQGKVNKANAHPFEFDGLVGAHNGTLKNKHILKDHNSFAVDSENLYYHIDEEGLKSAIDNLSGAWALTWYNKDNDTMNFLRNEERPLFLTKTVDDVVFWASEKWMLEVALARHDIKHSEIESLPVNMHHVFDFDARKVLKPVATKMASGYEPPFQGHYQGVQNRNFLPPTTHQKTETTATTAGQSGSSTPAVLPNPYKSGEYYRLQVTGEGVDQSGNNYFLCKDPARPSERIRLYRHVKDNVNLLMQFIEGQIHSYRYADRSGTYLKVEYSTFRRTVLEKGDAENKTDSANQFFADKNGKLIPKSEWENEHGTCAWCTGYVDPTQAFKFTREGEAVCHECVADPEVANYVNFR